MVLIMLAQLLSKQAERFQKSLKMFSLSIYIYKIRNKYSVKKSIILKENICKNKGVRHTLGTAPGLTLLRTLQSKIPLLKAILKSSSEGSAGKSLPPTTPSVCLSHLAASYLLKSDGSAGKSLPPTTPIVFFSSV